MSQLALKLPVHVTVFHVKVLAVLLMVADHIGYVTEVDWLRIVGRFSFPLFAWILVQGARHTKNQQRYERRLLVLAITSQPVYALFVSSIFPLNPVFQLWIGLVFFRLMKRKQMTFLLSVAIIGVATLFFDYHYYGIGLIYLISSYPFLLPNAYGSIDSRLNVAIWIVAFVALHLCYAASYPLQLFALPIIGLMPFLDSIHKRGSKARWFYWFYPLHFVPLVLLKLFS